MAGSAPGLDKVVHVLEYAFLGGLLFLAFAYADWRPWDAPLAISLGTTYGAVDELHQLFVPGRHADIIDVAANAVGVIITVVVLAYVDRRLYPSSPTTT